MRITELSLPGLTLIEPVVHGDNRGFFMEAFNQKKLADAGIDLTIAQHNHSSSQAGVVRGLHFQWDPPLGKLIRVISGRAYVVAVDIRKGSSTWKRWEAQELSAENKKILHLPFGFASGFYAYEEGTQLEYYYDAPFNPEGESNIAWNDPELAIEWPTNDPILSARDQSAQSLTEWSLRPESDLFR